MTFFLFSTSESIFVFSFWLWILIRIQNTLPTSLGTIQPQMPQIHVKMFVATKPKLKKKKIKKKLLFFFISFCVRNFVVLHFIRIWQSSNKDKWYFEWLRGKLSVAIQVFRWKISVESTAHTNNLYMRV